MSAHPIFGRADEAPEIAEAMLLVLDCLHEDVEAALNGHAINALMKSGKGQSGDDFVSDYTDAIKGLREANAKLGDLITKAVKHKGARS